MKIKLIVPANGKPFIRQLPNLIERWEDTEFFINEPANINNVYDACFVYGDLKEEETLHCAKKHTILIISEPPHLKTYRQEFLNQFGYVITSDRNLKHPGKIYMQGALPWRVGYEALTNPQTTSAYKKTYDELKSLPTPIKIKLISIITSNKRMSRGHRERIDFALALKKHFGDKLDLFGLGFTEINDKWDAIAPYKYHIAIENSSFNDYWTEKISDAFLAEAYPFYYGAPNLNTYFPSESFSQIDIHNPKKAIEVIEKAIAEDVYQKAVSSIHASKELVLDTYQMFPMMINFAKKYTSEKNTLAQTTLKPESACRQTFFDKLNRVIMYLKRSWIR